MGGYIYHRGHCVHLLMTLGILLISQQAQVVSSSVGLMLVGSEVFQVGNQNLSWSNAQQACEQLSGYLAEPLNITALRNYIIKNKYEDAYWIGGSDQDNEGSWIWTRSGNPVIGEWVKYQPNGRRSQNCLAFHPRNLLNLSDYSCRNKLNYICQLDFEPPGKLVSTSLPRTVDAQPHEKIVTTILPRTETRRACRGSRFRCDNGEEIKCSSRCDDQSDCLDHSDEEGCHNYNVSTQAPGGSREGRSVNSSDSALTGVIIAGVILVITIIGVATCIHRKARIRKQNPHNGHNNDISMDPERFATRRPTAVSHIVPELSHTGPEVSHIGPKVSDYDVPCSNLPVPGARADGHYDRLPTPSPVPGARGDTHYDRLPPPSPVLGARGDTHYDRLPKPVAYNGHSKSSLSLYSHSQEGNCDYLKSPASVYSLNKEENHDNSPMPPVAAYSSQGNHSLQGAKVSIDKFESNYDSPKSHTLTYPEATYDHPRRPSQGVHNPTFDTTHQMLYDSPRSYVAATHAPAINEDASQIYDTLAPSPQPISSPRNTQTYVSDYQDNTPIYDTPAASLRPVAIPRTTQTSGKDHQVHQSDDHDPIYANQNDVFKEQDYT